MAACIRKKLPSSLTNEGGAMLRYFFKIIRDRCASITLEAALLLPMVLLLFLFFIFMIQAAVISTSLESAAINAVKQVAAHMYPISLAANQLSDSTEHGTAGKWLSKPPAMTMKMAVREFGSRFGDAMPEPIKDWVQDGTEWAERQAEAAGERGQGRIGEAVFKPLMTRYGIQGVLQEERIRITHLKLPDIIKKEEPYVAIEVAYDLPMRVPFLMKRVTIVSRASERVWVGDGPPPGADGTGDEGKDKSVPVLVSLTPEPLLPGRKAKLTARVEPNERVELIVFYKSGQSQAKHVGWAVADTDGNIFWEWHVSGNTTSGAWRLVVKTKDGRSAERMFTVK